jgi:hypothetical protein
MPQAKLDYTSLKTLRQVFSELPPAPTTARSGFYRARFIGPAWLRLGAGPSVALGGLPGWQGKRFIDPFTATNVLRRREQLVEKFTMHSNERPSLVDGKPGVDLSYGSTGPIPWRWLRDELRQLDDDTLLGMTVIELPLFNRLAFPFLLSRDHEPGV